MKKKTTKRKPKSVNVILRDLDKSQVKLLDETKRITFERTGAKAIWKALGENIKKDNVIESLETEIEDLRSKLEQSQNFIGNITASFEMLADRIGVQKKKKK